MGKEIRDYYEVKVVAKSHDGDYVFKLAASEEETANCLDRDDMIEALTTDYAGNGQGGIMAVKHKPDTWEKAFLRAIKILPGKLTIFQDAEGKYIIILEKSESEKFNAP